MKKHIKNFLHWKVAGWLCWLACKCRGEKWYLSDVSYGVPGNHVSEIRQRLWINIVLMTPTQKLDSDEMRLIESDMDDLANIAGECWGHIWPKQTNSK